MSELASLLGQARDRAAQGNPNIHDHVCGIYDTHEGQFEPACRFIKAGLERKQQCLYIAEHLQPAEFMSLLETHGVDVNALVADGSLLVLSGRELRFELGGFTPESMLKFLAQAERMALESGFTALRLAADMTWLRQPNIAPTEMFRYEAELNRLLAKTQVVGLCQYAIKDFNADMLLAGVETHPLLAYNETVCDNFYYVPPEEYLRPGASDVKLSRVLYNIITRERLMQHFLSGEGPPTGAGAAAPDENAFPFTGRQP